MVPPLAGLAPASHREPQDATLGAILSIWRSSPLGGLSDLPQETTPPYFPAPPGRDQGHRYEHLIAFLLGSALRLGEALALRWADVDRQHASINVSHPLERLPGKPWRIVEPKSDSGRRVVPLIGPAADSLRAQRKRVAEMRLAARAWTVLISSEKKRTLPEF